MLGQHNFGFELRPKFMVDVVGQVSFLFHISQQFLPISESISVEKSKSRWGGFHFTFENIWEMWNGCKFGWLPWAHEAFPFHGPINSGEAGGHRSQTEVVLAFKWPMPNHCKYYWNTYSQLIMIVGFVLTHYWAALNPNKTFKINTHC